MFIYISLKIKNVGIKNNTDKEIPVVMNSLLLNRFTKTTSKHQHGHFAEYVIESQNKI